MLTWPCALRPPRARGSSQQRVGFSRTAPRCQVLYTTHAESHQLASPSLKLAAELAARPAGDYAPGPRHGCVLENSEGRLVAEAYQPGYFGMQAEVAAALQAGGSCAGGTAFLNLEPAYGPAAGDDTAVQALLECRVSRVVVGLLHPLPRFRGQAVAKLRAAGITVDVSSDSSADAALCRAANEALLHRVAKRRPFSIWKYAMTLDGKIATRTGHAAWVSSPTARAAVHELRAHSDAVIIGGETLRRDNPRLTTRRQTGHIPTRIVLTRTMDMPEDRYLWDVSVAPTIVMTEAGADAAAIASLRLRGVEVVIFDKLTPGKVADYCYARGYLQCLWECGGVLAAAAVDDDVLNKVHAYISLKVVGGADAPSPLGSLGIDRMDAALQLQDAAVGMVGPDVLVSGYLPASGTLAEVASAAAAAAAAAATAAAGTAAAGDGNERGSEAAVAAPVLFYKGWDEFGFLSNFSPLGFRLGGADGAGAGGEREWLSVEHYYQAQKFAGQSADPVAAAAFTAIAAAPTPEEAARVGRGVARRHPGAVHADWPQAKEGAMRAALRAKFAQHPAAAAALLATRAAGPPPAEGLPGRLLVENSQNDFVWGIGFDGSGGNLLGKVLMQVREEIWVELSREEEGRSRGGGAGGVGSQSVGAAGRSTNGHAANGAAANGFTEGRQGGTGGGAWDHEQQPGAVNGHQHDVSTAAKKMGVDAAIADEAAASSPAAALAT